MTIKNDGRVGIGTTAPGNTLTVQQSGSGAIAQFRDASNYDGQLLINTDGTFTVNGRNTVRFSRTGSDTESARIDSSGRLLVGTSTARTDFVTTPQVQIEGTGFEDSTLSITRNTFGTGRPSLFFGKSRGSVNGAVDLVADNDGLGTIEFAGADGSSLVRAALISAQVEGTPGAGDMPGRLTFSTTAAGASTPTERMRISANGDVTYGEFSATGATEGRRYSDKGRLCRSSTNSVVVVPHHEFYNLNGVVGSIQTSGSSTAYNTSSDYRLKENVVPLTGAADRLNQLEVHRFNFIADPDTTLDGFLAHEAQAVVPECVTGTKDEVDDDGNPVYQGIDQSKLVPLLTAALQEALAKIETLEQRLNDAGIA